VKHEVELLKEIAGQILSDKSVSDKKVGVLTPDSMVTEYYSFYPKWQPGSIKAGEIRSYEGINYYVAMDVTAIEGQPPGSVGVTAIYRPIPPRDEDGNILFYLPGMNVLVGERCFTDGVLYEAIQQMTPCNWEPGSAGTDAVWKKVATETKGGL
jgi:hypothetical protein